MVFKDFCEKMVIDESDVKQTKTIFHSHNQFQTKLVQLKYQTAYKPHEKRYKNHVQESQIMCTSKIRQKQGTTPTQNIKENDVHPKREGKYMDSSRQSHHQ